MKKKTKTDAHEKISIFEGKRRNELQWWEELVTKDMQLGVDR